MDALLFFKRKHLSPKRVQKTVNLPGSPQPAALPMFRGSITELGGCSDSGTFRQAV